MEQQQQQHRSVINDDGGNGGKSNGKFEDPAAGMPVEKTPISDCDCNDHHQHQYGNGWANAKGDTVAVLPLSSANGAVVRGGHQSSHGSVQKQTSNNSTTTTTTGSKRSPKRKKKKKKRPSRRVVTYERPPDGGWGWMVVLASFIINLIADGVSLSFGVIYVELVEYFNESKSKTAWVGSLFLSIPLITGPIASALVDHFGCRKVTIAGSLLAALGFFLGQFSTCIEHLFFAFSLSGFGLALCYVTSIVSVAYWFDKRRSLATGLAVCGTGFGTFLFAPFIIYLLNEYQWRGTLLILSAVFLNMICCGFLIRDLNIETTSRQSSPLTSSSSSSSSSRSSDDTSDLESNLSDSAGEDLELDSETDTEEDTAGLHSSPQPDNKPNRLIWTRPRPISECETTEEPVPGHTASLINIPTYIQRANNEQPNRTGNDTQPISADVFDELTFRRGGYLHNLICYYPHLLSMFLPSLDSGMQCDDLTVKAKVKTTGGPIQIVSPVVPKTTKVVEFGSTHHIESSIGNNQQPRQSESVAKCIRNNSTASRLGNMMHNLTWRHSSQPPAQVPGGPAPTPDYLLNRGNRLHNLRLPRGSLTYRSAMLVINKYRLKASSAPDIYRTSMVTINEEKSFTVWHHLQEILMDMVDISNFKSLRYTIFCLSNFLLYACIDVPYVYIPDLVITTGASDQEGASAFISIIGIFNTIGVVLVGYIGDKPRLDASFVYAILVAISGISMGVIPLSNNYYVLALLSAIYGFCISANYSLVSVILVELISLDSFTKAYGMMLLVQGFGSLIGPPLAGWLYDVSGNYDSAFYITGLTILISGLMVIPVGQKKNCFLWYQPKELNQKEETTEMMITGTPPTNHNHHRPLCQRLVTIEEDSEI